MSELVVLVCRYNFVGEDGEIVDVHADEPVPPGVRDDLEQLEASGVIGPRQDPDGA